MNKACLLALQLRKPSIKRALPRVSSLFPTVYCLLPLLLVLGANARAASGKLPDHVPSKRSSQINNGFGINSNLPREPYLPWNRWWWTRIPICLMRV